jgi:hypothetical protein
VLDDTRVRQESHPLRHCIATRSLDPKDKATQWKALRDIAGCDESATRLLQKSAKQHVTANLKSCLKRMRSSY